MINNIKRKTTFYSKYRNEIVAYSILIVPLFLWLVFFLFSFFNVFTKSFTDWGIKDTIKFIGLQNFKDLFKDDTFLKGFRNTVLWTVVVSVGVNTMALLLATLISKFSKMKVQRFFLTLLFWPVLVSAAASASIQKLVFAPDNAGLLNNLFINIGLIDEPLKWFFSEKLSLISLMIFPFFLGFGTKMLIFYAGIKNIPASLKEAAYLETSSDFKIFWAIIMPLLKPVIMFNVVLSVIEGFKVIAPMQLITQGKPLDSSMSLMLYIYNNAFLYDKMGYASAIGMIIFVILIILTTIQLKLDKGKVTYE